MNSATIQKLMRMVGLTKFIEYARTRQWVKLRESNSAGIVTIL